MEFRKYSEIENSYRQMFLEKIRGVSGGQLFHVQEKIHGTNFSLIYNDGKVAAGKRTSILTNDDQFYGHQRFIDLYKDALYKMALILQAKDIMVYGELFGGSWPQKTDVKNAFSIQKGVFYSPENHFFAFDVLVDGQLLPLSVARDICDEVGIPFIPFLFSGSLDDCLAYSNEFDSTIPALLGYDHISNNVCEGVVIKPEEPLYVGQSRVVLKNKNEKWSEKKNVKKTVSVAKDVPEHVQVVIDIALSLVTENRLKNVLSKIGQVTEKDFGQVLQQFQADVAKDLLKEDESIQSFERVDQGLVNKAVNRACAVLIRENFINIIDGNF